MKTLKPYQSFFRFYDRIYPDKFYTQYALFINRMVRKYGLKEIALLDLACGTGRLLQKLARCLKPVRMLEGLDSSSFMLQVAKRRNPKLKFYHQRLPNFYTRKRYSVITCTFDSLNYLTKQNLLKKAAKQVANHLVRGGLFIFDFNTNFKRMSGKSTARGVVFDSKTRNGYWIATLTTKSKGRVFREIHRERLYSYNQVRSALAQSNLMPRELYVNFSRKLAQSRNQPRLIVVAQKILN